MDRPDRSRGLAAGAGSRLAQRGGRGMVVLNRPERIHDIIEERAFGRPWWHPFQACGGFLRADPRKPAGQNRALFIAAQTVVVNYFEWMGKYRFGNQEPLQIRCTVSGTTRARCAG
jgi:hypothetical protein